LTPILNGSAGGILLFGDINGDGKEDFIKATGAVNVTVYPYLANSSGGFTAQPAKTLASCNPDTWGVALGDIDGDGWADIVSAGVGNRVHAYLSNGDGTFGSAHTTIWSTIGVNTIFLADLNGDGKADLLKYHNERVPPPQVPGNGLIYAGLSNGDGYFGNPVSSDLPTVSNFNPSLHANKYTVSMGDVNGDGIPDLYSHSNVLFNFPPGMSANVYGVLIGNGSGGFDSTYFYHELNQNSLGTGKVADVNGDGLADLIFGGNGPMAVFLSTGTGMASPYYMPFSFPNFAMSDLNDDGITDMILESSGNNYFFSFSDWPIAAGGPTGTNPIILADINGDGRADIIKYNGTSISYSMANGDNAGAGDQIELITNPLGGETNITYGNNTDILNNMVPFELHPVMDIQADDGYNISLTSYAYSGTYYNYEERDFRGFGTVIQTNPDATTVTTTYEQLDDYKKGRPLQVDMKNPSGTILKRVALTWGTYPETGTSIRN
jgi:hypothetical protein